MGAANTSVRLSSTSVTTLDIAQHEGVSQPAVTKLVNRLADDGLVHRVRDPADRRAALVSITASGKRVLAEHRRARAATLRAVIAQLPADRRKHWPRR